MNLLALKILIGGVILYLIWALFHHRRDKSLTLEVCLEYFLTAVLVLILLMGVII